MRRVVRRLVVALATLSVLATGLALAPGASAAGSLSGTAFDDADRDGQLDAGEARFPNHQLYLYRADGSYVGTSTTDGTGQFSFAGLADGAYRVQYASPSWWDVRKDWVPTTTGTLLAKRDVEVAGAAATANFGWRRIVRSTDAAAPLSAATTTNGIRVESFDDAVTATTLAAAIESGGLLGAEGSSITLRFDLSAGSSASTSSSTDGSGRYVSFGATVYVTYVSWLESGDRTLFHELGHAWSQYYGYLVQQDPGLHGYLTARGLADDARVGSAYAWQPDEMVAEDYRQLFGSPNASSGGQANTDIPTAAEVAGLRDYLMGPFRSSGPNQPPAQPAPAPASLSRLAMSPAPVSSSGTATVDVSAAARVRLQVTDAKGALVKDLADVTTSSAQSVSALWDRTNKAGRRVKAGTYTLRAEATSNGGPTVVATSPFKVV